MENPDNDLSSAPLKLMDGKDRDQDQAASLLAIRTWNTYFATRSFIGTLQSPDGKMSIIQIQEIDEII